MSLPIERILKLPAAGLAAALNWRRLLPATLRLYGRVAVSFVRDVRTGTYFRMEGSSRGNPSLGHTMSLSQTVVANAWQANKLHNFRIAAQQIHRVTIGPGRVFSFWKAVGRPTKAKGYKLGRNLVVGQVRETIGGGLCQLSGILYHLSLLGGLEVVERHHHSVDLYANGEPRFTPLGADAAVAYGYKDLRVANPYDFAIRFELELGTGELVAHLRSEKPIVAQEIAFVYEKQEGVTQAITLRILPTGERVEIGRCGYRV